MCLFSRLSVGQGLCCCLPCCWLQRSMPPRAGPGPELAISEQQRLVLPCWRHGLLQTGGALPVSGFCRAPLGFVVIALLCSGALVVCVFSEESIMVFGTSGSMEGEP